MTYAKETECASSQPAKWKMYIQIQKCESTTRAADFPISSERGFISGGGITFRITYLVVAWGVANGTMLARRMLSRMVLSV